MSNEHYPEKLKYPPSPDELLQAITDITRAAWTLLDNAENLDSVAPTMVQPDDTDQLSKCLDRFDAWPDLENLIMEPGAKVEFWLKNCFEAYGKRINDDILEIATLKSRNEELHNELLMFRERTKHLEDRYKKDQAYIKKMDGLVDEFKIVASCINPYEDLRLGIAALIKQRDDLGKSSDEHLEMVAERNKQINTLNSRNEELHKELRSLRNQLSEAQTAQQVAYLERCQTQAVINEFAINHANTSDTIPDQVRSICQALDKIDRQDDRSSRED